MNKLRRLRSLSPEMAETLRLAGVQGIFWAAMAVGNYQTVYLQSIGFPATDFGLLNAIACAVAIFAMTFWGTVSDRIGSVRKICHFNADARLRPFHFCATHSDGAILLDAIISNLDPDHQLFPRTDVAVCR